MAILKYIVVAYLVLHALISVPNIKYSLEITWPSALAVAATSPFYTVTWMISERAAQKIFTPLYVYEDPHHVVTERVLVSRQPDGKWE